MTTVGLIGLGAMGSGMAASLRRAGHTVQVFDVRREVAAAFAAIGADKAKRKLIYCGGGIAATLDAFLLYQLGHENIAVYDASMNEWAKDESLPMEVG